MLKESLLEKRTCSPKSVRVTAGREKLVTGEGIYRKLDGGISEWETTYCKEMGQRFPTSGGDEVGRTFISDELGGDRNMQSSVYRRFLYFKLRKVIRNSLHYGAFFLCC